MRHAIPLLLVFLAFSAGCITSSNSATTPSEAPHTPTLTASPIETTPTPEALPNVPKPRENCTVEPLPNGTYSTLPTQISESSAASFTRDFEKTYGRAQLANDQNTEVSGFDGWSSDVVNQTAAGYVVQVTVRLDFVQERDNTTLAGSTNSHGWYYVTESFAVRAPSSSETIPQYGWETIVCK